MNFKSFLNSIQHKLSRSKLAVVLAIKLRNQCNSIIAYHLAETSNHYENGESWLIEMIAADCSTFIDVGAYIGDWSECFLNYAPKDYSGLIFEPSESAFHSLENKFKDNLNLSLIQLACSDSIGEAIFYDEYPKQSSSLIKNDINNNSIFAKNVKISTLDEQVTNRGWGYIDFLKIDCEGYDMHVLRGG
ncbi:MAG: FkbM family methyltransferase [Nostoc sp.]|uniref:FkbM family methyltransferase n=1 Tax=Nostoc sp. TaxID=1180 RepID=UPI002FF57290